MASSVKSESMAKGKEAGRLCMRDRDITRSQELNMRDADGDGANSRTGLIAVYPEGAVAEMRPQELHNGRDGRGS